MMTKEQRDECSYCGAEHSKDVSCADFKYQQRIADLEACLREFLSVEGLIDVASLIRSAAAARRAEELLGAKE